LLQQVDSRVNEIEHELESLDDGSELEATLRKHSSELEKLRERIKSVRRDAIDLELMLKGIEEKLEEMHGKMRSGAIRNPREVVRIEGEIRALERQKDEVETKALQRYEELDELEGKLKSMEKEHEELVERLNLVKRSYSERLLQLQDELEELKRRRQELVTQIDEEALEKYERLRERKGGLAVATVEGELCSACRVTLTASTRRQMDDPQALPTCENCGRIICPPETQEAEEE
jgi:predicted  nucleic acid-binding Zn-ribbon protein